MVFYPLQAAVIIGANVDGKPDFMASAWGSTVSLKRPMGVGVEHDTPICKGILQNMTLSVNIPSFDMVKEVDSLVSVSGAESAKKAKDSKFKVFYGKLDTAPMIEQCLVNLEFRVEHVIDLGSHTQFIGYVEETHVSEDYLTDGKPDFRKIKPLWFSRVNKEDEVDYVYAAMEFSLLDPRRMASIDAATLIRHPLA